MTKPKQIKKIKGYAVLYKNKWGYVEDKNLPIRPFAVFFYKAQAEILLRTTNDCKIVPCIISPITKRRKK